MIQKPPATLALLLTVCAPCAFAISSLDLRVTGTITPSSCTPSLSNGGVVDHGKLAVKDLDPVMPTSLKAAEMLLEVHCESATLFTLAAMDNRAGTAAINPDSAHGLGMVNSDQKLGSVWFGLYDTVADSSPVHTIMSRDGGITWSPSSYLGHAALTAVTSSSGTPYTPSAVQALSARIRAFTLIVPASDLSTQDELPIDGHTTVQLRYW